MVRSSASVVFAGAASPGLTLSPLRRGGGDPCYYDDVDGSYFGIGVIVVPRSSSL